MMKIQFQVNNHFSTRLLKAAIRLAPFDKQTNVKTSSDRSMGSKRITTITLKAFFNFSL